MEPLPQLSWTIPCHTIPYDTIRNDTILYTLLYYALRSHHKGAAQCFSLWCSIPWCARYRRILKNPIEYIEARPLDTNILEWHFVITGNQDPYTGGALSRLVEFFIR